MLPLEENNAAEAASLLLGLSRLMVAALTARAGQAVERATTAIFATSGAIFTLVNITFKKGGRTCDI